MVEQGSSELSGVELLHAGTAPLNAVLAAAEPGYADNIGIYSDGRYSDQLTVYIFLYEGARQWR